MPFDRSVTFLIAGVQKGGTTALFDYLSEHPSLCLPSLKEAHFFDNEEDVDWDRPDYGAYHALFEGCEPNRLRGEATPIYIYWPPSLKRIAAYNPDMRLIFVFRDPIERAWSQWRMETLYGTESEPFAWCIREGRDRVVEAIHPAGAHRIHSYVERGFYGAQLSRTLELFPRDQLLCLSSEDLLRTPERILRQVCDFLHAPSFGEVSPRRSLVGREALPSEMITVEDRTLLRSLFEEDQKLFEKLSGISFPTFRRIPTASSN